MKLPDAEQKEKKAAVLPDNLPPLSLYEHLVPAGDRELLRSYAEYLSLLLRRGLRQKGCHPKSFNLLYRAVSRPWGRRTLLGRLQEGFIARNLSLSVLLEPLDGCEWLSKKRYPLELASASPVWLQIISPVARLIAVLNNQSPPFYQPFSNLAFVYVVRYLEAVPQLSAALQEAGVAVDKQRLYEDLPLLHKESLHLLSAASGIFFRLKIGFFIGLGRRLCRPESKKIRQKINFFDYVNAFLYGLWHTLAIKNKTRGLDRL